MGKIATLSWENLRNQVVILLRSAFSNKHSVFVHPEPKSSIFSELSCLIDISNVYGKRCTEENCQKEPEKDFRQISERQDLLRKLFFQSHKSVA